MSQLTNITKVHLYTIFLSDYQNIIENDLHDLSNEEKIRASKIISPPVKKIYIQSHCLLRIILSWYLKCKPIDIIFNNPVKGKPTLTNIRDLYFNISYREEYLLVAVSNNPFIGCDIEKIRQLNDPGRFLELYYSGDEIQLIHSKRKEADVLSIIYQLWTMKEAYLKATGIGINDKVNTYSFLTFLRNEIQKPIFDTSNTWHINSWPVNKQYFAAFAVKGEITDIKHAYGLSYLTPGFHNLSNKY